MTTIRTIRRIAPKAKQSPFAGILQGLTIGTLSIIIALVAAGWWLGF
jgi:hypothetical protein